MPPKQKQAKKGPAYKNATPLKDLLPPAVKELSRESRPIKTPDSYPEIKSTDTQAILAQFPALFEQWPTQQIIKNTDFGIASDKKFEDPSHEKIVNHINGNGQPSHQLVWKNLHEIQEIKTAFRNENPDYLSSDQDIEEQEIQEKKQGVKEGEISGQNTQQKIEEPAQDKKQKQMVVIETYLREETEEEMQKRKQEEAEKAAQNAKDKKKGKKQEPKEEGPMQISDVKMDDIKVRSSMCESGIWIGSQLQIIKQRNLRDVYTGQSVWKKIYPQEDGVPKITQSGKYWVKLYYMGKPVKIQIDDRMPIDSQNKQLFPISKKQNEKWTLILTKALIKLFCKISPSESMIGSGLIIYALTGMITENISLKNFNSWQKISKFMGDEYYTQRNILLSAFTRKSSTNSPSNQIRTFDSKNKLVFEMQNCTFKKKRKIWNTEDSLEHQQEREMQANSGEEIFEEEENYQKQKYVDNGVIKGYSYCIGDYLENEHLHMAFSRDRSSIEKQLREQYSEFCKISFANKSRQQKLEHRRKKKQVKQKLQFQQRKRLDEINKPNKQYHFLKLLGNLSIICSYTNKQILLAKKCKLNELEKPPNYEIPVIEKQKQVKQESKSGLSTSIIRMSKEEINSANIEVNPSLDDFSGLEKDREIKDVLPRNQLGVWIEDQDLLATFDEIQIFYDPNSVIFNQNVSIKNVELQEFGQFSHDPNSQVLLVEKVGNPHLQQQNQQPLQNKNTPSTIKLLFGYSYHKSKWDTLGAPYCMLQKFDFDSYRTTAQISKLQSSLSSSFLELKNQNTVFKIYTLNKGRYAYWISCSAPFKLMSIAKYLQEIQNYSVTAYTIEYPPLEVSAYFPIAHIEIKQKNKDGNTLILKFQNSPQFRSIQKFLSFRLVEKPGSGNQVYTTQKIQGISDKIYERSHLVNQYTRIQLDPLPEDKELKVYYLVVEAFPNTTLADGTLNLQILMKNQGDQISQLQQIQPYKIVEKYTPNKYGNIMKERIYPSKSNNVSLYFKVLEGEEGQPIASGGAKGGNKKGGKQQQIFQIIQKPLKESRLIHFKLFKNNTLLYYTKGYNQIVIPSLSLESSNGQKDNQYYIQTSFDLRDWPQAISVDETSKIYWSCQIYGDQAIAFVKDTKQEEKQKQTRKSWEDKQPGRAEKAKKSRERFLLQMKKDRGQELTEQQLAIVNAPRMTRKQLLEEQKKNEDKKGAKGAKKDDKKGKDKKDEVVEQKKEERIFPKSQDNFMVQLKTFLKNLEDCKVAHEPLQQNQEPRIRSQQEQQAIKEGASMCSQNRIGQITRNIQTRQTIKIKQKDKKDKLTILLEDSQKLFSEEWKKYIEWRIEDKEKDALKQQKQKAIMEIIKTAMDKQKTVTNTEADLQKIINQYKDIQGYSDLMVDTIEMIRKNVKIANLVEKINNLLSGWEVDQLKIVKEEMEKDRVEGLDEQLIKQINQLLETAESNPALVQEKQAELKKGKKGGKK